MCKINAHRTYVAKVCFQIGKIVVRNEKKEEVVQTLKELGEYAVYIE